jgi:hypothetical protein
MITYTWSILELFGNDIVSKVRFTLKAQDETNTVETEGYHEFTEGLVCKSISEIKESDLIGWLVSDTTQDGLNPIKLNLENQLKSLKIDQKIDFPWENNTFTAE